MFMNTSIISAMKYILNKGSNIVKIAMKVISNNGLSISSIYNLFCIYVHMYIIFIINKSIRYSILLW